MAYGEVRVAAQSGHELPEGVGVDRSGQPTTNPQAIVDGGALLPFGGHKGSSIAMMIEVLAAALTGGNFSFESDLSNHPGAQTPRTGELVLLFDPQCIGAKNFTHRIEDLVTQLHTSGQSRLPGDRRYKNRAGSNAQGILLTDNAMQQLNAFLIDDAESR